MMERMALDRMASGIEGKVRKVDVRKRTLEENNAKSCVSIH